MASLAQLRKRFEELITRGRLGHAYLFFGGGLEELLQCTQSCMCFLERGTWEHPGTIPLLDGRILGGGTEPIGIDDVRAAKGFLAEKPFLAKRRTLVIARAELLTSQAAPALLKLLEEPPPAALILLTVRDLDALLTTIRSRCERFYVTTGGEERKDPEAQALVRVFLAADRRKRSEQLKAIVESPSLLERFVASALLAFHRSPRVPARTVERLLFRWTAISQYNTNKRLQLEAALLDLPTLL